MNGEYDEIRSKNSKEGLLLFIQFCILDDSASFRKASRGREKGEDNLLLKAPPNRESSLIFLRRTVSSSNCSHQYYHHHHTTITIQSVSHSQFRFCSLHYSSHSSLSFSSHSLTIHSIHLYFPSPSSPPPPTFFVRKLNKSSFRQSLHHYRHTRCRRRLDLLFLSSFGFWRLSVLFMVRGRTRREERRPIDKMAIASLIPAVLFRESATSSKNCCDSGSNIRRQHHFHHDHHQSHHHILSFHKMQSRRRGAAKRSSSSLAVTSFKLLSNLHVFFSTCFLLLTIFSRSVHSNIIPQTYSTSSSSSSWDSTPSTVAPQSVVNNIRLSNKQYPNIRVLYQSGVRSDSELPICSPWAVCNKIDTYSVPWVEKQCSCPGENSCSTSLSEEDGHTIVDKNRQFKVRHWSWLRLPNAHCLMIVNNPCITALIGHETMA